jgi:hypothetical protein
MRQLYAFHVFNCKAFGHFTVRKVVSRKPGSFQKISR